MFHENQYGFRKRGTAVNQNLRFLETIYQQYHNKKESTVLYLNFIKAFDKVDHSLLTKTSEDFEIIRQFVLLLTSCLNKRLKFLKFNVGCSKLEHVTS